METKQNYPSGGYGSSGLGSSKVILFKKISWAAIIAGLLIAMVLQLLLSLLGLGIGLGTINPTEESQPFQGLGTGSLIWWIITMLVSLFVGGWIVGRQSNLPEKTDRVVNAVLMWCIYTIITVYFLSSVTGSIVRGAGNVAGATLSAAGSGINAVAPEAADYAKEALGMEEGSGTEIIAEIKQILRETGKENLQPENIEQEAKNAGSAALQNPQQIDELINRLFGNDNDTFEDTDKEALVNVIVARTGKSETEARAQVDNWITTYKNTKAQLQKAKEEIVQQAQVTGEEVASAASKIAIFSFIGLVLGALAAGFGSVITEPVYDVIDVRGKVEKEV